MARFRSSGMHIILNDTVMYLEWHKHVTDVKLDSTAMHLDRTPFVGSAQYAYSKRLIGGCDHISNVKWGEKNTSWKDKSRN